MIEWNFNPIVDFVLAKNLLVCVLSLAFLTIFSPDEFMQTVIYDGSLYNGCLELHMRIFDITLH